jgi:FkbM family methyltransferase
MLEIRALAKSAFLRILGQECRPRLIVRGLPSGYRIKVSPAEHLSYLLGTAEPHLQRAIKLFVSRGDTVYDVGANLGYVAMSLAKQVGPTGTVIAFEPLPQNLELLRENIANNRLANIEVFDVAVSDQLGEAVIRVAGNLSTASLIWHKSDTSAVPIEVKTIAIDDLVADKNLALPTFVKIDVEGAEALVLRGMRRTVTKARPVLFVECSEAGREETWHLLSDLQYECRSAINRKRLQSFEEYRHSDFLWTPKERKVGW